MSNDCGGAEVGEMMKLFLYMQPDDPELLIDLWYVWRMVSFW